MNFYIDKIMAHERLTFAEAERFMHGLANGELNTETIAGVLVGIQMRGVDVEELKGFRAALLQLSIDPQLDGENAIDLCGTGGDGKNTFNISTTTALVLSAMGHRVIKHGNYGVSSMCGSSNVLEELGFEFTNDRDSLHRSLDETNICFLHAPLFHPTMKAAAPIRGNLGVRTIFNVLGPLVNPAQPKFQVTGTFSLELAKIYQHILKDERTDFRVVYGMDGYDELTLTDSTRVLGQHTDTILDAQSFGVDKIDAALLFAGDSVKSSAEIIQSVLAGKGTDAQTKVIAANCAVAQHTLSPNKPLAAIFENAVEFIQGGTASQQIPFAS